MRPLLVLLVALAPLVGCLDYPVEETDGSGRPLPGDPYSARTPLELRYLASGGPTEWTTAPAPFLRRGVPVQVEEGTSPPNGGGGTQTSLADPTSSVMVEARLLEQHRVGNETVRWYYVLDDVQAPPALLAPSQTFSFNATRSGDYNVFALVGPEPIAGGRVRIGHAWEIHGRVHPLKPQQAPTPDNYDEMLDLFRFNITYAPRWTVLAQTSFDGDWPSPSGTDVALGLLLPGFPAQCVDAPSSTEPDPAQAKERAVGPVYGMSGVGEVSVGAPHLQCPNRESNYFNNVAPVPYRLDISVYSGEPGDGVLAF